MREPSEPKVMWDGRLSVGLLSALQQLLAQGVHELLRFLPRPGPTDTEVWLAITRGHDHLRPTPYEENPKRQQNQAEQQKASRISESTDGHEEANQAQDDAPDRVAGGLQSDSRHVAHG